jgi:predicted dehydrogenase
MDLDLSVDEFTNRDWHHEMDDGPLRLAVIGLGGFARTQALPAIQQSDYCEATVVVSGSPEKAETVGTEFATTERLSYDDFHDGGATDAYDAIYIATPNAVHLDYADRAADFGKHVLCEKPMEVSVERAERIIHACADAGVTLMIAYRLQTDPVFRRIRELLQDGSIGNPVQVHGHFSVPLLSEERQGTGNAQPWRIDPDLAGGGALMDIGIYPLNTTRFLLDADPIAVQATTAAPGDKFNGIDEHVAFQLVFPDDVTASCTASFSAHRESYLHVIGTEGRIHITNAFGSAASREISLERNDMRLELTGPTVNEVIEEFDYFATNVLTGSIPEPDGEDGLMDLRVIEVIYEAAETGSQLSL